MSAPAYDRETLEGFTVKVMAEKLREGLVGVTVDISQGFKEVMRMYKVAFYLGVVLIGVSIISSLFLREAVLPIAFGAFGLADIAAVFIFKPVEKLQISRANLAQLQAAYASWVNDIHNWNDYWKRTLNREDYSLEDLKMASDIMINNTEKLIEVIQANIR